MGTQGAGRQVTPELDYRDCTAAHNEGLTVVDKELFWEDFTPGRVWTASQSAPIATEHIIAFATEYDPLDIHIDPDRARASPLGVHCASGVQTFGISQRLMCDALLLRTNIVAGGKIDDFRMVSPVVAGDLLTLSAQVIRSLIHSKNRHRGWVVFKVEVSTTEGKTVLCYRVTVLILRRCSQHSILSESGFRSSAAVQLERHASAVKDPPQHLALPGALFKETQEKAQS
jgi:acyl dehydratase